jgi:hypothetical protein
MGWVEFDATWMIAPVGGAGVARASAAPNAKDKTIEQAIAFTDNN